MKNLSRRELIASATALVLPSWSYASQLPVFYRTPGCVCCHKWSQLMGSAGLPVDLRDTDNLDGMQQSMNVPPELRGCHAGLIDGYVISGHVPPDDIKRLLAEKPEGAGLAVPGMPMGSPGMDVDGTGEAFDVVLFGKDGSSRVFQSHS